MSDVADKLKYLRNTKKTLRNRIYSEETDQPSKFRRYSNDIKGKVMNTSIIYGSAYAYTSGTVTDNIIVGDGSIHTIEGGS